MPPPKNNAPPQQMKLLIALAALGTAFASVEPGPCGEAKSYAKGEKATLCVTVNYRRRAVFDPVVDQMSMLRLDDSTSLLPPGSGVFQEDVGWVGNLTHLNMTGRTSTTAYAALDVALGDIVGVPHIFKEIAVTKQTNGQLRVSKSYAYPVYTAIVWLNEGKPEYVTWDEGCFLCPDTPDLCRLSEYNNDTNAAGISRSSSEVASEYTKGYKSCAVSECSGNDCDVKLYIVWTGTDKNGEYLESANLRLSRFRAFGISGVFDASRNAVIAGANDVNKAGQDAEKIPSSGVIPGT